MLAAGIAPFEEVGEDMAHEGTEQEGAENHSWDFRQGTPLYIEGLRGPEKRKSRLASGSK